MRKRLITLTVITSTTLLCIIALQAFWLRNSFITEKTRFKNDMQNALNTVVLREQITIQLFSQLGKHDSLSEKYLEASSKVLTSALSGVADAARLSEMVGEAGAIMKISTSGTNVGVVYKDLKQKTNVSIQGLQNIQAMEPPALPMNERLAKYSKLLTEELQKRQINIPFNLAIKSAAGKMLKATCDTNKFNSASFTVAATDYQQSNITDLQTIEAAFPGADTYLLRQMAWMLIVSGLLVLICSGSFAYLILLFFRQKRIADMRNDFMNNMTHELKTPISSVSVALELLQDERQPLDATTKHEYFSIAQSELKRLNMLVEKVLKMAAFEKSEIHIVKEPFAAKPWLRDIISSFRPIMESNNVQLQTTVVPEQLSIYADKTHLTNVLQNLIENAVKYNDKNEPAIYIDIYEQVYDTVIKVRDNGKGIPPAYVDKVFDKFFRVPSGDRHDTKGYGLGLSYVKAIVELHGGTIEVTSHVGDGSTFTIHLPHKPVA